MSLKLEESKRKWNPNRDGCTRLQQPSVPMRKVGSVHLGTVVRWLQLHFGLASRNISTQTPHNWVQVIYMEKKQGLIMITQLLLHRVCSRLVAVIMIPSQPEKKVSQTSIVSLIHFCFVLSISTPWLHRFSVCIPDLLVDFELRHLSKR